MLQLHQSNAIAQEEKFFSDNSEIFIEQIGQKLTETSNKKFAEDGRKLMQPLGERWNAGRFNKDEKDGIKAVAELLHAEKVRIYPQFYNFFRLVNQFAYSLQLPVSIVAWNDYAIQLLQQKRMNEFNELVGFTSELLADGRIFNRNTLQWLLKDAKFSFASDSLLRINVDKADLVCATQRDTSIVSQTSGTMVYGTNQWVGKGGVVFWRRFKVPDKEIYAELSNYYVDLQLSEYFADSVIFRNLNHYDKPMLGSFQDKVFSSPPNPRTAYPRFNSYDRELFIKDVFPGIDFKGGLTMEGLSLYGSGGNGNRAVLTIRRNNDLFARLLTEQVQISKDRLLSDRVTASLFIESDSLYHPGLRLRYTHNNRQLTLYRSETGLADSPFFNSFHKVDIYVEALYWDLDKTEIAFRRLEGIGNESSGRIESANYYADIEFSRLQGIDDLNPLFVIDNYLKTYSEGREIRLNALAVFMKKPVEQVVAQLLRLASHGFLVYDPATQTAQVKDRFYYTLEARAGKTDYDVIRLNTNTSMRLPNAILDLNTLEMAINGVPEVILSDSQRVNIFPDKGKIVMKKNRDFVFSGLIRAGLFDFYARDCFFEYDSFRLNMTFVDSLAFYARVRQADRTKFRTSFTKVRNVIANLNGTLFIDAPNNKSGLKSLPRFPIFNSQSESYVFFDQAEVQSGSLNREVFYYAVDPFEIDSLDNFSTDNLRFEGYLASAGIFPGFREPLVVMPDYSLGFIHDVPTEGYPMFADKARYFDNIHLSNLGFYGKGAIDYLTTRSESEKFVFYPDSVTSAQMQVNMSEQLSPVEFPRGQSDTISMHWMASDDVMRLRTIHKPFLVFNNAEHHGQLDVKPSGMSGAGRLDFGDARVTSEYFEFKSRSFDADTADFSLFTAVEKKEAFAAQDYKTSIDFDQRIGKFSNLSEQSSLSFPFNQYICSLDEASWMMDDDRLILNNNVISKIFGIENLNFNQILDLDLSGSGFTSTHPEQDSLSFFCLEAEYDLVKYAIEAKDVKIIRVADAAIFPDDGRVTILQDARMQTLESATIIANTTSRLHLINDARVAVFSKNSFEGRGYYDYIDVNKTIQPIELSSIWVDEKGVTNAMGSIPESAIFFLNPYFFFHGQTSLKADRKELRFKGGYKVNQECMPGSTAWISFDTLVDPQKVRLPVASEPVDLSGLKLGAGLTFNTISGNYYPAFLDYKRSSGDLAINQVHGYIYYDESKQAFIIESDKVTKSSGSYRLLTNRCLVEGDGPMNLDLNLGLVAVNAYGTYIHKVISDSTYVDWTTTLNFIFDDKLINLMADSLSKANLPGVNLLTTQYLASLSRRLSKDEVERIQSDINLYSAPRRIPEGLDRSIVLADVKLKWNPETRSFVSYGPLGIANILRNQVNKYINGYLEIEKGRGSEGFTLFLQPDANSWYFFNYRNGMLQAISSSQQFNNSLVNLKADKRITTNRQTAEQYEFIISTERKVTDFIRKMQSVQF
jgi:hypothetical protein